jgi:hypothetical protein
MSAAIRVDPTMSVNITVVSRRCDAPVRRGIPDRRSFPEMARFCHGDLCDERNP